MTIIFKAKTREGYTIKVLGELLQSNIKIGCFEIDKDGIKLRMMDHHRRILIDLKLDSDNFSLYRFRREKMYLGINLNHFHKMLKSIKKKDSMVLLIESEHPNDLKIRVIPRENNRVTTSCVKIQAIQNISIDLPTGYGKPIIVPSGEYQKMCKDMGHIGNIINVTSKNFHIRFLCNAGSVYYRDVLFGEYEDSDDDSEEELEDDNELEYNQNFDTEQLIRITKIAGLHINMKIFPKEDLPLLFTSQIGTLGQISIYIKSQEQLEQEKESNLEENEYVE